MITDERRKSLRFSIQRTGGITASLPATVPGTLPAVQHAISNVQRAVEEIQQTLENHEDGGRKQAEGDIDCLSLPNKH